LAADRPDYFLTLHCQDHPVLEQSDVPANAWRNHRWDSFTLNTPRWQSRLPGVQYGEDDPDGFMPRDERLRPTLCAIRDLADHIRSDPLSKGKGDQNI